MKINNHTVKMINKGAFSKVYRSLDDSSIVFILTGLDCYDKEIYAHVGESTHIPYIECIDDEYYHLGKWYRVYKTTYSETLTNKYPELMKLSRKMQKIKFNVLLSRKCRYESDYAIACQDIVEAMREDQSIPLSVVDDLESLLSWAVNCDGKLHLEFNQANLAVVNGNLILRDVIFFRK